MANNVLCLNFAKGDVIIENEAIAKLAGIVATGCYGVVGMAYRSKKDEIASLLKKDTLTKGIKVNYDGEKINIDMHIIVQYGVNINVICDSIIKNVKYQLNRITGVEIGKVDVYVEGFRIQE